MDCEIKEIRDLLLDSYREIGGINHIDCNNLPSKRSVGQVCELLLQVLFPGFHDEEPVAQGQVNKLTTGRLGDLIDRLETEAAKSLAFVEGNPEDYRREARTMVCRAMHTLPEIRRLLRTDVDAAYEGDPAARSFEEIILSYPCVEAIAIQRIAHLLYQESLPLLPRIMTEWAHSNTGIDIHPGARIGPHFFIDHGTGVVVGETCVIGAHVKLYHGVTLGARSFEKDPEGRLIKGVKRHPEVEDDVTIYPNATILGGRTVIGARSTIGANAFLMQSVPPDSLVAIEEGSNRVVLRSKKSRENQVLESTGKP